MSIKNIQQLQHPSDLAYLMKNTNEYVLHSLANLGQRVGIKGDGIDYASFDFYDILNTTIDQYSPDKYIGIVKYKTIDNVAKGIFGIVNKDDIYDSVLKSTDIKPIISNKVDNVFNNNYITSDVSSDIAINNIEKFKQNGVLAIDKNSKYFYNILYGKVLGTEDDEENNMHIYFNKYDLKTGVFDKAIRVFHLYDNHNCKYYVMLYLYRDQTNGNNDLYKLRFSLFDVNTIEDTLGYIKPEFIKSFRYKGEDNVDNSIFNLFGDDKHESYIFDENGELIEDNLFYYSDDYNCTIFGLIQNNESNKIANSQYTIEIPITFKNKANVYFHYDTKDTLLLNKVNVINEVLEKSNIDLSTLIDYLNNDIVYTYPFLLKYYNNSLYKANKSELTKQVICKLYEKIYNDFSIVNDNEQFYVMYVPLTYKFYYLCNNNDNSQIYYSNNQYISIKNIDKFNKEQLKDLFSSLNNILYARKQSNTIDKVSVYSFNVNYNNKYTNLINNIDLSNVFTLPYINNENTWSINDSNTFVPAVGKNAGNPNIMIAYTMTNVDPKDIVSQKLDNINDTPYFKFLNVSNNKLNTITTFDGKAVKIKDQVIYGNYKNKQNLISTYLPHINSDYSSYFTDALLINITDTCGNTEKKYITTLWKPTISEENNEVEFSYIVDPSCSDGCALDLYSVLNFTNSDISGAVSEDVLNSALKNIYVDAIFTDVAKNTINNELTKNYINIRNAFAKEYTEDITIESNKDYNNNLNLVVEYLPKSCITSGTKQLNKYLDTVSLLSDKNTITNQIYPKIEMKSKDIEDMKESIKVVEYSERLKNERIELNTKYLEKKAGDDGQIKSSIYEVTVFDDNSEVNRYKYVTYLHPEIVTSYYYEKNTTGTYNYDEYVFNKNIPTIDYKEIFLRNLNTLNRYNIITPENIVSNKLYYAYIGTSFDENDKRTLHIGTSNLNINIGDKHLMDYKQLHDFAKHDKLSLDFPIVETNSVRTAFNNVVDKKIIDNTTYYNSIVTPMGMLLDTENSKIYSTTHQTKINLTVPNSSQTNQTSDVYTTDYNILKIRPGTNFKEHSLQYNLENYSNISYSSYLFEELVVSPEDQRTDLEKQSRSNLSSTDISSYFDTTSITVEAVDIDIDNDKKIINTETHSIYNITEYGTSKNKYEYCNVNYNTPISLSAIFSLFLTGNSNQTAKTYVKSLITTIANRVISENNIDVIYDYVEFVNVINNRESLVSCGFIIDNKEPKEADVLDKIKLVGFNGGVIGIIFKGFYYPTLELDGKVYNSIGVTMVFDEPNDSKITISGETRCILLRLDKFFKQMYGLDIYNAKLRNNYVVNNVNIRYNDSTANVISMPGNTNKPLWLILNESIDKRFKNINNYNKKIKKYIDKLSIMFWFDKDNNFYCDISNMTPELQKNTKYTIKYDTNTNKKSE